MTAHVSGARLALLLGFVAALVAAGAGFASPAHAATSTVAVPFPLAGDLPQGADLVNGALQLGNVETWSLDGSDPGPASLMYPGNSVFRPRSVQLLDDGSVLVADGDNRYVAVFSRAGGILWRYCFDVNGKSQPFSARRLEGSGTTVIADRGGNTVLAVDSADPPRVLWRYGDGQQALGLNHLFDAFSAMPIDDTHVLITESLNHDVLEVDTSHYVKDAPNAGFHEDDVVVRYGVPGMSLAEGGVLQKPHFAQVTDDGTVVITDSGDNPPPATVLSVDPSAGPRASPLWTLPPLSPPAVDPNQALYLEDRDTVLIADTNNDRVVEEDRRDPIGRVVWSYGPGMLSKPRAVARYSDGSTLISDYGNGRLVQVGYPTGTVTVPLEPVDCGSSVAKRFLALSWSAIRPSKKTHLALQYRFDGRGVWHTAATDARAGGSTFTLPAQTAGATTVAVRALLWTHDRARTASLAGVSVTWRPWRTSDAPAPVNGGRRVAGHSPAPVLDMGGSSRSGGGGGGTGSGSGAGSGTGSGGSGSEGSGGGGGAGGGTPPAQIAAATVPLPTAPATPSASASVPVTGVRVETSPGSTAGAPGALGGGGNPPAPPDGDGPVPRGLLITAVLVVIAAALLVRPTFARRTLRRLVHHDHAAAEVAAADPQAAYQEISHTS